MAICKRDSVVALASATSANGTARNGTTLTVERIQPGTLMVECVGNVKTSSVVATYKVQVSQDNTTWVDLKLPNNASNVATDAGTGSDVAHSFSLTVPLGIHAYLYVRGVATLSGASTAAADVTAVTYYFIQPGGLF
jgi:hypothetical protein